MNINGISSLERQYIISLRLLTEIEKDPSITQRTLSNRLGIALGLTNAFIKHLVRKGYIKAKALKRNRIIYLITPKGIKEKSRLTCQYMRHLLTYYREVRRKIDALYNRMSEDGIKRIVFFGESELAELAYISLRGRGFTLIGIVDDDKVGKDFFGYRIMGFDGLKELVYDAIVITSMGDDNGILNPLMYKGSIYQIL